MCCGEASALGGGGGSGSGVVGFSSGVPVDAVALAGTKISAKLSVRLCVCVRAFVVRACVCGVAFTQVTPDRRGRHRPSRRYRRGRTAFATPRLPNPPHGTRATTTAAGREPILDSPPPPPRCVRLVGTDHPAVLATKNARLTSRAAHRPTTTRYAMALCLARSPPSMIVVKNIFLSHSPTTRGSTTFCRSSEATTNSRRPKHSSRNFRKEKPQRLRCLR